MPKIVQFLEKNVEWFALGLGALFLGWAAWTYLINPPVSKVVAGNAVTPGNVDDQIWNTSGERLKAAIEGAQPPNLNVPDFTRIVEKDLSLPPGQPLPFVWDFQPAQLGATPGAATVATGPVVTQLPVLPPAKPLMVIHGQTTIVPMAAPVAMNAPAPPVPAAAQPGHKDIRWTTLAFTIPIAPLSDQWTKAFGPNKPGAPTQYNTEIIALTAYRSEKLPGGGWSEEKEVPRLLNNVLQPFPTRRRIDEINYQSWAANHTLDIATPPFPTRAPEPAGAVWKDPLTILQGLMTAAASANPAPATPAPAAPAGPRRGGTADAEPVDVEATPTPSMQGGSTVALTPLNEPKVDAVRPLPTVLPAVPQANFSPAATTTDLLVYLHDDQVTPGKTYRYRITYMILNPLFGKPADRAASRAWVDQLELVSGKSDYSSEVTIEPQTFFYCAAPAPLKTGLQFEVFTWAAGLWQKHLFTVNPGDAIGTVADGVDYYTGYTYVDGRTRNRQYYVTVVDDGGQTSIRRADLDSNSSDHKTKQQWVDLSQGKVPGTPGPGGGPATRPAINEGGDEN